MYSVVLPGFSLLNIFKHTISLHWRIYILSSERITFSQDWPFSLDREGLKDIFGLCDSDAGSLILDKDLMDSAIL